jgi:polar amino acid transport system permease protein
MLKDSSLASAIGVEELSRRGREFTMSTFKAFETWTMVALLYLIMTVLFSQIARSIERRMAAGE